MNYHTQEFTERYGLEYGSILHKKFSNSKKNANKRGIQVSFEWEDIDMLSRPLLGFGLCDYTNQPFGEDDMKPSIERIDATKGYERGNVCVVTARANIAKSYIFDATEDKATLSPKYKETLRQIFNNCTSQRMEELKQKYVPSTNQPIKQEKEIAMPLESHELEIITKYAEPLMEEVNKQDLPEDVQIAEIYSKFLRIMADKEYEITLTFSEFKSLMKVKRCFITGELLNESKLPVLFDQKGKVERSNMKFANQPAADCLANMLDKTGLTVQQLVSNLTKTLK